MGRKAIDKKKSRTVVIVPARIGSTRIPRKPLQKIGDREVVLRVCDAANRARLVAEAGVATDSEEILRVVEEAGYPAWMTSAEHPTGTDRIAEAARRMEADIIVNVQGDEPFLPPEALDRLLAAMDREKDRPMGTLVVPLERAEELEDPNVVKVVADRSGRALYFSRAPVPWRFRETEPSRWKHVGVYAFRREALFRFVSLPRTELERSEGLEQLRALDHGMPIHVEPWPEAFHGVETPEDLERAREIAAAEASAAAGVDGTVETRGEARGEDSGS